MTGGTLIVYQVGPVVVIEECDANEAPFTRQCLTLESAVRIGDHMAALGRRMLAARRRAEMLKDLVRT